MQFNECCLSFIPLDEYNRGGGEAGPHPVWLMKALTWSDTHLPKPLLNPIVCIITTKLAQLNGYVWQSANFPAQATADFVVLMDNLTVLLLE